jgi:hypothetical protein
MINETGLLKEFKDKLRRYHELYQSTEVISPNPNTGPDRLEADANLTLYRTMAEALTLGKLIREYCPDLSNQLDLGKDLEGMESQLNAIHEVIARTMSVSSRNS